MKPITISEVRVGDILEVHLLYHYPCEEYPHYKNHHIVRAEESSHGSPVAVYCDECAQRYFHDLENLVKVCCLVSDNVDTPDKILV